MTNIIHIGTVFTLFLSVAHANFVQWQLADDKTSVKSNYGFKGRTILVPLSKVQFLYQVTSTDNSTTAVAPAVNVTLYNGDTKESFFLEGDFNVTNKCSCYELDANALFKRFPNLKSGRKYSIQFQAVEDDVTVSSGLLGIERPNDDKNGSSNNSTSQPNQTTNSTNSTGDPNADPNAKDNNKSLASTLACELALMLFTTTCVMFAL